VHILERSGVGASIDRGALPRSPAMDEALAGADRAHAFKCLIAGGDDYELCFAAPPAAHPRIVAIGAELGLRVTRVGAITADRAFVVRDEKGTALADLPRAFDHFAQP
jgi:thiamine-monophosphate kinase